MEQKGPKYQWKGKVKASVPNAKSHQIWLLFQDFFGIYKWFPTLSISLGVAGNNGEIGSIRYCKGSSIPSQNSKDSSSSSDEKPVSWRKERLIAIDSTEKSLSYEIVDSNIGFNNYVSTIKVLSRKGEDGEEAGCSIEWSFSVDPVEGFVLEDLVNKYEMGLLKMSHKMEDAFTTN